MSTTKTPNINLNVPLRGTVNWDTDVNENWNIIDENIGNKADKTELLGYALNNLSNLSLLGITGQVLTKTADGIEFKGSGSGSPLGAIQHLPRTDVPAGMRACDGMIESVGGENLDGFRDMLINGKLRNITFAQYTTELANNQGICTEIGWNPATNEVRYPLMNTANGVYIKASSGTGFGKESLPNITGTIYSVPAQTVTTNLKYGDGCFGSTKTAAAQGVNSGGSGQPEVRPYLDASLSSPAYQDNAKVNGDHAKLRAFIQVSTGVIEASQEQQAEIITNLTNKMDKDGSNSEASALQNIINASSNGGNFIREITNTNVWIVKTPLVLTNININHNLNLSDNDLLKLKYQVKAQCVVENNGFLIGDCINVYVDNSFNGVYYNPMNVYKNNMVYGKSSANVFGIPKNSLSGGTGVVLSIGYWDLVFIIWY